MISTEKQSDIIRQWIGTPYAHGRGYPGHGVDCVHLVKCIQKELGFEIPVIRYRKTWRTENPNLMDIEFGKYLPRMMRVSNRTLSRFGDICTFKKTPEIKTIVHIGVMVNPSQFIHIMDDSLGTVRIDYIRPWLDVLYMITRMVQ